MVGWKGVCEARGGETYSRPTGSVSDAPDRGTVD